MDLLVTPEWLEGELGAPDLVVLDASFYLPAHGRDARAEFEAGHVPGALNLPAGKLVEAKLRDYPMETLFVVYCAGPHCNGADRAAADGGRLTRRAPSGAAATRAGKAVRARCGPGTRAAPRRTSPAPASGPSGRPRESSPGAPGGTAGA